VASAKELEVGAVGDLTGTTESPFYGMVLETASHWPGISKTIPATIYRTHNTYLYGGWKENAERIGGIRDRYLNPRTLTRYPTSRNITGPMLRQPGDPFEPFGMFRAINFVGSKATERFPNVASDLFKMAGVGSADLAPEVVGNSGRHIPSFLRTKWPQVFGTGKEVQRIPFVEGGLMGRISAGGRMNRLGAGISETIAANAMKHTSPAISQAAMGARSMFGGPAMSPGTGMLLSSRSITGRAMGGYMAGMGGTSAVSAADRAAVAATKGTVAQGAMRLAASTGDDLLRFAGTTGARGYGKAIMGSARAAVGDFAVQGGERAAAKAVLGVTVREGAESVAKKAAVRAGAGLAAKVGVRVGATFASGPAAPVVGALMAAWTAYDIAKIGMTLGKAGVQGVANTARDSIKSFKGSIEKPIFGMGYKDTEVAMTSRARGVAAIQNSRLNARSMLGSEAGMMASHFG
jgi:hypothetical protein